jgi:2-deoxy-D-gluconate 3-dehydrogenase
MSSKLFDLTGRVALVTGGNGGIGLGMARGLAGAGAAIMVAGRNETKNAAAVAELQALGVDAASVVVDVADPASCDAMVATTLERFGRVDCLVNNAGTAIRKQPQDYDLAEWQEVLTTNLTSAFKCSQAVYAPMKAQGGGKIIMIGSMMSIFGASFSAPYASSKGGIVQLGKSLATSWAGDNIQVNTVLPGWIDTALTVKAREQVDGLHQRVLDRTPAGRWGEPDDHSGIAVFLASRGSDFVTGTSIPVDGGFSVMI